MRLAGEPWKLQPLHQNRMLRRAHGTKPGLLLSVLRSQLRLSNLHQPSRQRRAYILTGPGLASLDYSLVKNTHITELFNVQLRAECFNLLNRANLQVPPLVNGTDIFDSTGAPNSTAGVLTSTTTSSRQIQLGVKVIW